MSGAFSAKRLARLAALTGVALILSYVESLFPLPLPVPGIKLGLANCALLITLYVFGVKDAALVSAARVLAAGFLFLSPTAIMYSAAGALASLIVMSAAKSLSRKAVSLSVSMVSVLGATAHNAAQIALAAAVLQTPAVFAYLPALTAAAAVTGMLTGIVSSMVIGRIKIAAGQ